jgi:hypothetical protein
MPTQIPRDLLEAYSRGESTRREIEDRSGEVIGFGALLMALGEHHLTLPRGPVDPQSPGVQLLQQLAERAHRIG